MENGGEVKVYNTAKKESELIVFPLIQGHINALQQARTGKLPDKSINNMSKKERIFNRVKALHLIIKLQEDLIMVLRPVARTTNEKEWRKKYKEDKEQIDNPFEEEDNDYNKSIKIRKFLSHLSSIIVNADTNKNPTDDLIKESEAYGEKELTLTQNFRDILSELEDTYEEIYMLLIKNKMASAGINEDEELEDKQKEEEAMRRILDA